MLTVGFTLTPKQVRRPFTSYLRLRDRLGLHMVFVCGFTDHLKSVLDLMRLPAPMQEGATPVVSMPTSSTFSYNVAAGFSSASCWVPKPTGHILGKYNITWLNLAVSTGLSVADTIFVSICTSGCPPVCLIAWMADPPHSVI